MISIIIPAHQEEEQIGQTLNSLTNQSYNDFEVIVVANGCSDKTVDVARKYKSKLQLSIIETGRKGIGYSCNLGADNANGQIILILEADTILSRNGLQKIVMAIERGYVGGTLLMKTKEKRLVYSFLTNLQRLTNGGNWGPVRFCTYDAYKKINGHNEEMDINVDGDFKKRVKSIGKTIFIDRAFYETSMRRFEKLGSMEILRQSAWYISFNLFGKNVFEKEYPVIR